MYGACCPEPPDDAPARRLPVRGEEAEEARPETVECSCFSALHACFTAASRAPFSGSAGVTWGRVPTADNVDFLHFFKTPNLIRY